MAARSESPASKQILEEVGLANLPQEWGLVRIEELLSDDRGISVGVMYPGDHDLFGVPLIKSGDLGGNLISSQPEFRITRDKHNEYKRTALEGGELLLSLVGDVGRCAIVPTRMAGWNVARAIAVLRLANPADARFLRTCLLSAPIQHLMHAWSTTTVQATLNLKEIRQIPLPWPHADERNKIAGIIGALDDKIEINRKMNETLDAMARALFKSWFVDFAPVRAKVESSDTGLPSEVSALFPDSLEESELGLIPRGWTTSTIKSLAHNIQYGLTTSAQALDVGPKFLRITDIQAGHVDWSRVPYCRASDAEYERYRLKAHDIVVARTGASTGENVYLPVVPNAVFASYLVRFQFELSHVARFVGAFMRTSAYFEYVQNSIGGSAQPNASAQVLAGVELVLPPPDLLRKYAEIVAQMDQRLWHNSAQSITLVNLRDTLLPKLISGEIRLPVHEPAAGEIG